LLGRRFLLWHLCGEFFDFDEERAGVVDADAVCKEDDAACSGNGDEHPGVDGQAEDRSLGHRRAVSNQRGFDCEFEGAYSSGRAGDQVGEIGKRDGKPGADAIDRLALSASLPEAYSSTEFALIVARPEPENSILEMVRGPHNLEFRLPIRRT